MTGLFWHTSFIVSDIAEDYEPNKDKAITDEDVARLLQQQEAKGIKKALIDAWGQANAHRDNFGMTVAGRVLCKPVLNKNDENLVLASLSVRAMLVKQKTLKEVANPSDIFGRKFWDLINYLTYCTYHMDQGNSVNNMIVMEAIKQKVGPEFRN